MQEPIYRCLTKGVKGASEAFAYGLSWVTARRSFLSIFHDRLECGNWIIPYGTMTRAVLFETRQMWIPCYILKIQTADACYQFGLNGSKFWAGELPFAVTREAGRLKYSTFSIALRVVLVVALLWYLFSRS